MNNYNNLNNNMNKINDKNLMIVNYNSNQQKDSNSRRKSKFDIMNDENSLINNTLKSDSQNSNGLQVSQTSTEINNQQKEFILKESLENMPVGIMATIINQQKKAVLYQF